MCRPQSAAPANATAGEAASASTASAAISTPSPHTSRQPRRDPVGGRAGRIGKRRVDDVHDDHDQRHVAEREPDVLRAQDQERLAEARQGEDRRERDDEPVAPRQALRRRRRPRRSRGPGARPRARARAPPTASSATARNAGTTATHSTALMSFASQHHEYHRQQRPEEGAHRVERLAQAVGGAAQLRRRDVGDQRVARRAADALADAIDEARREHPADRRGEREHRLGEGSQRVAEDDQRLALPEVVADRAGEHLRDRGGRLRDAFDQADGQHRGAEDGAQEYRQQAVDQLRGGVHEQRAQTEHPDPCRQPVA